jgi:class 3 adenylate cyclase/uncharacterized protein (DUF697 family)
LEPQKEKSNIDTSVIMFTDIKDFTLKTSLLTNKQVEQVLVDHNTLVIPIVERHHGKIIKVLWDAFMIIFTKSRDAIDCSLSLQKSAAIYNAWKKLNLFKIELRISIDKWEVIKTKTLEGDDYFWEAVNMSSRLESITPENTILITGKVYEDIKSIATFVVISLGKTSFRWILYEVEIYKVLYDEREIKNFKAWKITTEDLKGNYVDKYKTIVNKTDVIIFECACVAALLWIQPLPFLDNLSILPLYVYMIIKIASLYGEELDVDSGFTFIKKIIAAIWLSYLALHVSIGFTKIILPIVAGYAIIPINFGITFWLGKIVSMYYYSQDFWVQLSNKEMKNLFKDKRLAWKNMAEKQKETILEKWKQFKREIEQHLKDIANKLKK